MSAAEDVTVDLIEFTADLRGPDRDTTHEEVHAASEAAAYAILDRRLAGTGYEVLKVERADAWRYRRTPVRRMDGSTYMREPDALPAGEGCAP